jgi:MerR family transcriptional regulator, copper efflux regulator
VHAVPMLIGELAGELGVDTHVLRHWEDAGLLRPDRTANGYRTYDQEQVTRAHVIRNCRSTGLGLATISALLDRHADGRRAVIDGELAELQEQIGRLARTTLFLEHVRSCRHSLMRRCPACSEYSRTGLAAPAQGDSPPPG